MRESFTASDHSSRLALVNHSHIRPRRAPRRAPPPARTPQRRASSPAGERFHTHTDPHARPAARVPRPPPARKSIVRREGTPSGGPPAAHLHAPMEPPPHEDHPIPRVDGNQAVLLLGAAAFCEVCAASVVCSQTACRGMEAYAVAVGSISLIFLLPLALHLFMPPLAPAGMEQALPHLSAFQSVWWLPATFLLTFIGPFEFLGTGYFVTLGGAAAATMLCLAHVPEFERIVAQLSALARAAPKDRLALFLLGCTSTVVWIEAAISIGFWDEHTAVKAWGIVVGVVSSVLCSLFLLMENAPMNQHGFAALLWAWWLQGVAMSFIPNQFISTVRGGHFRSRRVILPTTARAPLTGQRVRRRVGLGHFRLPVLPQLGRPVTNGADTDRAARRRRARRAHHELPVRFEIAADIVSRRGELMTAGTPLVGTAAPARAATASRRKREITLDNSMSARLADDGGHFVACRYEEEHGVPRAPYPRDEAPRLSRTEIVTAAIGSPAPPTPGADGEQAVRLEIAADF